MGAKQVLKYASANVCDGLFCGTDTICLTDALENKQYFPHYKLYETVVIGLKLFQHYRKIRLVSCQQISLIFYFWEQHLIK